MKENVAFSCGHVQRAQGKSGKKGESNFEEHKKSLSEVDEKCDELRKKHGNISILLNS